MSFRINQGSFSIGRQPPFYRIDLLSTDRGGYATPHSYDLLTEPNESRIGLLDICVFCSINPMFDRLFGCNAHIMMFPCKGISHADAQARANKPEEDEE
jgi:hypothetical protein